MRHFLEQTVDMFRLDLFLQLGLATLFGGAIGLERELGGKPAGLRTNILICIGSVLYTKLSITMASGNSDPTRVAAQIVTGVGFIGAGTILHARGAVVGLTSAATIWVVAAIVQSAMGSACTPAEFVSTTPVPRTCGTLVPTPAVLVWAHLSVPRAAWATPAETP